MRPDPPDAQFVERAAELRTVSVPAELLRQRRGRRAGPRAEDGVPIGVQGRGHAVAADELAQEQEVSVGVLRVAEDRGDDAAGGIVDRGEEHAARATVLQPGMVAAVDLDEQPCLQHPFPATAMTWRAPGAGATNAGGTEQPLHGPTGHSDAVTFAKQFRELVIVHAYIARARQRQHLGADRLSNAPRRGPTAVAMRQRCKTPLPHPRQQPPDLANGEAQQRGRLRGPERVMLYPSEDLSTLLLLLRQGDRLPVHYSRVTESLARYRVTNSLTYYTTKVRHLTRDPGVWYRLVN